MKECDKTSPLVHLIGWLLGAPSVSLNPFALCAWFFDPKSFWLVSLHSARGSKNCKLSELVECKLVDLNVFPSSVDWEEFLVA